MLTYGHLKTPKFSVFSKNSILGGEDFQWQIYLGNGLIFVMETRKKYPIKIIFCT